MATDWKSTQPLVDRTTRRRHGVTLLSLGAFLLALFLLTALLLWSESTLKLDRLLHDAWVRVNQRDTPKDLVIVGIDPQSLQDHGRWPWSRALQAQLFENLGKTEAKGFVIDLLYTEQSPNREDDVRLGDAIKNLPKTVLPVLTESRVIGSGRSGDVERLPVPQLLRHVQNLGQIQMPIDDDGIVRRVFLMAGFNVPHWPTLSLAAHQAFAEESEQFDLEQLPGVRSELELDQDLWLQDFEVMIPFYGPRNAFTTVSAGQVLSGNVPADMFKDKVVFVGMTSAGLEDVVPTPVSALDQPIPGVEIHANLFAALRDGSIVTRIDSRWNLVVALGMLPLLMWTYSRAGPEWSLAAAIGVACTPIALSFVLYQGFNLWFPPLVASVPILVSYLAWSGNRLRFVNQFLATQSNKIDLQQPPRERYANEDLTRFFINATMHLPIQGWRFTNKSQSHVGGEAPPSKQSGLTDAWVRNGDIYGRKFPTDDRLEVLVSVKDPLIAGEITRYIDRLDRVRRRVKPSIWHGSIEQLQDNALKLGEQMDWLRAVKSFSDSILEGSPAGFVVWNVVGEPIRLNELLVQLLPNVGKRPLMREFIEKSGVDLSDENISEHFENLMQRGKPWQFTVHHDEKELLVGLSAVGRSLSERLICATVIDVSEIRTAERARAEMMDYLSHDLRSPLVSSLYLLDEENVDDLTAEDLNSARKNIQSSLSMMENLLHMSRADTVSVESFKEVLLDNVIDNVTSRYIPQAKSRNIDLHVSVCDDELWLFGDAGLLDRAIGNLLNNAIKYSNEGGDVWLDVVVTEQAGDAEGLVVGREVIVKVRDDGVGIDPAIIDSLFTRFKRDPSVADRFRGIGLGLALVARVARQHGGSVTAHSGGKGAEFIFRLPLDQEVQG